MNDYIRQVCKMGQGKDCCKYLASGVNGLECLKVEPSLKALIDDNWVRTLHVAQGDNCQGKENLNFFQITEDEKK